MTDPNLLVLGGTLVVTQGAMSLAVGLLRDYLGNGKKKDGTNGYCKEHLKFQAAIDNLVDAHREEQRVKVMTKALTEALKRNGYQ